MGEPQDESVEELTYPLGAAARLTGLTADTLRAWERRYGVVVPLRTPGGTRRYRAGDLERLRLVKAAVDGGHRIGQIAGLSRDDLLRLTTSGVESEPPRGSDPAGAIFDALERLDADESERLIALQLAALGPGRFARQIAAPLLDRIGRAWADGDLSIAAEHLATSVLRSLLGASLRHSTIGATGAPIVFGTMPGEHHEMGLLFAAITAAGAGGRVLYLGPDIPVDELVRAVEIAGAGALTLSVVARDRDEAISNLRALREALPPRVELWVGGSGAGIADDVTGVAIVDTFEALEHRVKLFGLESGRLGL